MLSPLSQLGLYNLRVDHLSESAISTFTIEAGTGAQKLAVSPLFFNSLLSARTPIVNRIDPLGGMNGGWLSVAPTSSRCSLTLFPFCTGSVIYISGTYFPQNVAGLSVTLSGLANSCILVAGSYTPSSFQCTVGNLLAPSNRTVNVGSWGLIATGPKYEYCTARMLLLFMVLSLRLFLFRTHAVTSPPVVTGITPAVLATGTQLSVFIQNFGTIASDAIRIDNVNNSCNTVTRISGMQLTLCGCLFCSCSHSTF